MYISIKMTIKSYLIRIHVSHSYGSVRKSPGNIFGMGWGNHHFVLLHGTHRTPFCLQDLTYCTFQLYNAKTILIAKSNLFGRYLVDKSSSKHGRI